MALRCAVLAVVVCLMTPVAWARARLVEVNGVRLAPAALQQLDRAACQRVPDGRYWIDWRSGAWGYRGGPQRGWVGEGCRQRPKSLSERGLLYSPGELLR
ncbi:MAG: hypothetical protein KDE68_04390 [Rhodocyclaceae bacterium]|nr:hypothetical protein [Rhodocyclaceae bacterium]